MNVLEWKSERTVRDGRIVDPGKFEMEMEYVEYFWEKFMEGGCADSEKGRRLGFEITKDERRRFGLKRRRWVWILERDDGFVVEV